MDGTLPAGELIAAINRRLRSRGEQPWLFFRRGWDWRWWSFREAWQRAAAGRDLSDRSPLCPEERLVSDLAAWVGEDGSPRELVRSGSEGGARSAFASGELARLGRELERLLAASLRPPPLAWRLLGLPRSMRVAVDTAELECPATRVGWAWSLLTGASLALVADEDEWLEAVMWIRPTDSWGDASRLDRLARAAAGRRGRRSLARLGGFALVEGAAPAPESAVALYGLGIRVVRHPLP